MEKQDRSLILRKPQVHLSGAAFMLTHYMCDAVNEQLLDFSHVAIWVNE